MKRAAIGVRMHSGWGVLVAVSNRASIVEVIERLRVAITSPGTPAANRPYHFAANLGLPEAEKFLGREGFIFSYPFIRPVALAKLGRHHYHGRLTNGVRLDPRLANHGETC